MAKQYTLDHIRNLITEDWQIAGEPKGKYFTDLRPVLDAEYDSLVFISAERKDKQYLAEQTKAGIILCDSSLVITEAMCETKCFILVADPKLVFARIGNILFKAMTDYGVHPTAFVHPEAQIHPNTYIGPFTYIGKCTIDKGTLVYGHVHLYDGVIIGKNVVIHAGCVIGSDGFGFLRGTDGGISSFPHIGAVNIEDDVELQADCHISRGALGNTIIGRGSKFDSGCHIAHNVVVGKYCLVAAHVMISGSVTIGDRVWIAPSAAISDHITIGQGASVTIGSVVTRDVGPGERVSGNFAIRHAKFIEFIKTIR